MSEPELDGAITNALHHLDAAAMEASVHDDPLQRPFTALASFLRAQRALYETGSVSLAQHLEAARQPVRDDELRRAVISGIGSYASLIVKTINVRTSLYGAVIVLVFSALGFTGGVWWQRNVSAARVAAAEATVVEARDGFGTTLRAIDASIWHDIVRMNPYVSDSIQNCQPLKQPRGGSACLLPIWTLLPPPATETPATH